jgi:oxygen-independent coproporphyrinogen-3 oxidase
MTSLRTIWGTSENSIEEKFGSRIHELMLRNAAKYISSGDLIRKEKKLFLSEKGKLIADRIASDLFITEK